MSNSLGDIKVKRMPESRTTVTDINAYLHQLRESEGFQPDFLCIDYIDLMNTAYAKVSSDNVFMKDKFVSEEVRGLGLDHDAIIVSASQLNRTAVSAEVLDHSHIAGGLSKIQTADYAVGILKSAQDIDRNTLSYHMMKSRTTASVGKKATLNADIISLRITSQSDALRTINKPNSVTPTSKIQKPSDRGASSLFQTD